MKNQRKTRTVWVIMNPTPLPWFKDRRKNVVHFIHHHDRESGLHMHDHTDEEEVEGAMEFTSKAGAEDYFRNTLRGHYSRELKAVQVTITTSYKFDV